jgi:hypothetical protein
MGILLGCWEKMDPDRRGLTASEAIFALYKSPPTPLPDWHEDMKAALEALVGRADSRSLGNKLRNYRRRIFAGRFIDYASTKQRAARWAVFPASAFRDRLKNTHKTQDIHASNGVQDESGVCGESLSAVDGFSEDEWASGTRESQESGESFSPNAEFV